MGRMILLTGGSACGKSTYAEKLAVEAAAGGPLFYVAAMQPFGEESLKRIERHREMRREKGFETVERYTDTAGLELPVHGGTALLECLCNLTANEMFSGENMDENSGDGSVGEADAERAVAAVVAGVKNLAAQTSTLVVVTNDVGSDGGGYDELTMRYVDALGRINSEMAALADEVYELVCGIPLPIKR